MSSTEVNVILGIVLVLMKMKTGMDRVLMDGERVWHNIVSLQQVVSMATGLISLGEFRESGAEVGVVASVRDVHDMLRSGHVLRWVGLAMVNEWGLMVQESLVGVVHWSHSVGSFVHEGDVVLVLKELLHVHFVVGIVLVCGAGLNKSKSEHQKRSGKHLL